LQPGDELVRFFLAAKINAVLIQTNLPPAFAALILRLDDNLHVDHLLERRPAVALVGEGQDSAPA